MKMRKIFAAFLTLCMFMSMTGVFPLNTYAANMWDGTINTSWYTAAVEFEISTAAQLAGLAAIVNGTASGIGADTFEGKTITLTSDLNLNSVNWTPIGNSNAAGAAKYFKGTFNGNGMVISNLSITGTYTSADKRFFGLFGIIGTNGSVRNVGLNNISIITSGTASNVQTGSLAAWNYGTIASCYAKDVNIGDSTRAGNVGGLVGYNWGTTGSIQNCYVRNVSANLYTGSNFGGFAGLSAGTISNCYMGGTYSMNLSNGTGNCVGQFIAYNRNTGTITNCYYVGTGTSTNGTGGSGVAIGVTAITLQGYTDTLNAGGNAYKADTWKVNRGDPILTWESAINTSWYNTTATVFEISTAAQLAGLAAIVNGTADGIVTDTFAGKTINLASDIDLKGSNWTPIGNAATSTTALIKYFNGTFNGNNKVIKNLSISSTILNGYNFYGIFGIINTNGVVSNLGLENVSFTGTGAIKPQAGTLVALSYGRIEGCYAKNVTFSGFNAAGNIGGLVAYNLAGGGVKNSYVRNISANLYTGSNFGGFVGLSMGTVTNCYMGGTYSINLSNGTGSSVGPFIAYGRNTGTITNCYYEGTGTSINGTGGTGVAVGVTAAALKGYAATLGTAFKTDSWNLNGGYPLLSWEREPTDTTNQTGISSWIPMPIVSQALKNVGVSGGEGGQWELAIACDPIDGNLLLAGTDVGGMFRSTDSGATWAPCNRGLNARGVNAFAIDPRNKNRILAIGCHSKAVVSNGIYLSTDAGYSWTQVLSEKICGHRDLREQIAFDPSSYNAALGGSMVAYWSRAWEVERSVPVTQPVVHTADETKGLFKTTDGGSTWQRVNEAMSDGVVKVHPTNGTVYVANINGFHKSTDGGNTFTTILTGVFQGLDIVSTMPDNVYLNDGIGVLVSTDSGNTFQRVTATGFPANSAWNDNINIVRGLKVSPADPNYMLVTSADFINYQNSRYYSKDGGSTWTKSTYNTSKDMIPFNNRQLAFAWHPTDKNKVWSFGGDWVASSTNGGASFKWDHNGNTGIHTGGYIHLNVYDPNILYFGSQDFNGAVTTNGGETWKYINMSGLNYGGFVYGGYAANALTYFGGSAEGWHDPRILKITFDGGNTFVNTGLEFTGLETSYQSANNPNVLFASDLRSADGGHTWERMVGCKGVLTHNPGNVKELYGASGNDIVVSYNDGVTWSVFITAKPSAQDPATSRVWDVAYDGINETLYYVSGRGATGEWFCSVKDGIVTDLTANILPNQYGIKNFQKVAVDTRHPEVIYVGGYSSVNINHSGVQRSCDGGSTFYVVTSNTTNSIIRTGPEGGFEPVDFDVQPLTGELYYAGECTGWRRLTPPYKN